jgi:hypothetical protein
MAHDMTEAASNVRITSLIGKAACKNKPNKDND